MSCKERGGGDGGVITPPPHGNNTQYSSSIYLGGRLRQRGDGDIHGVFYAGNGFVGVTGRQMTGGGKKPRENQITLHVSALEGEGGNYTGGTGTTANIQSPWDAYYRNAADETQTRG